MLADMRCPACHKSISLLAPELNTWQRVKFCAHCQGAYRLRVHPGKTLLFLAPLTFFAVAMTLLTAPGWEAWCTGAAAGLAVLLSLEPVAVEDGNDK